MGQRRRLPGTRDVRATIDTPSAERVVVACPPHPQMGGDRTDSRLQAVSDALANRDTACLRIDYGPWDEGRGERTDVQDALEWGRTNYAATGLFGYSFGGTVALLATAATGEGRATPDAVSVLAPAASVAGLDAAAAVQAIECPLQVVYGERDDTVDSVPVAEKAREHGGTVTAVAADHFYVGQQQRAGERVAAFLDDALRQGLL